MPKFADLTEGGLEEKWLYFLKHGHELTAEQAAALGVPEITEAERKLTMISQNRDLRVQFERRMKAQRDAVALTRDAWLVGKEEGKAEGVTEGKRLGIDEGKQQAGRDAVLQVLAARGLPISAEVRAHIAAETDLQVLQSWLVRAAVAGRAEEILDR